MRHLRILLILATQAVILLSVLSASVRAELPELLAVIKSDSTYTGFGKRIMPLGDQNGDGYADIMVADLTGKAFYYLGRESVDTVFTYDLMFESVTYLMNNIGDVNGDDIDDFLLPRYFGGTGKLDLYYGGADLDTVTDQWFGYDNLYGQGYSAFGFDFDQDNIPEIVSWGFPGGSTLLYELTLSPDSVHDVEIFAANLIHGTDYAWLGSSPAVGYFNGDSIPDLALGLLTRLVSGLRGAVYFYWGGESFDTIPDLIIERPGGYIDGSRFFGGEILEDLGDLNDDGFGDIFASSGAAGFDSLGFVFFGGQNLDSIPELTIKEWHSVARKAGDVNNDGVDDLILGRPAPFSGLGEVHIYFGGTDMDSIPDITFTNSDMPGYQVEFGFDCSGVGDFNGDGIDDFAFSLRNVDGYGLVLIYSGVDMSTSVDLMHGPVVPESFLLSQNFPNPFNPTTTIEFALPTRSEVSLRVYNVLGKQVITLMDKSLSAGIYSVEWNGKDKSGEPVASGVYFYKLMTEESTATKKMVLLK